MSGLIYHTDKRRVLPKIERFGLYKETEDIFSNIKSKSNPNQAVIKFHKDDFDDKLQLWNRNKTKLLSSEIISSAIINKRLDEVQDVIDYLRDISPNDEIMKFLFDDKKEKSIIDKVNYNRHKLQIESKDVVSWIDQSINFMFLNNRDEAIECIDSALKINSKAGFVLRNASRILNLTGNNNRAISILQKSEYFKFDPQLLSAEIAFSQLTGNKSKGLEIAKRLIINGKYANYSISELASALATMEFDKRNFKESERYFDLALKAPNSNSLAQIMWYKKNPINNNIRVQVDSNEIRTHQYSNINNFEKSFEYSLKWKSEEPFNKVPYSMAAHLKGVLLEDFEEAYKITLSSCKLQENIKGKYFSEDEKLGFNNDLAYYLLKQNKIEEAEDILAPAMKLLSKKNDLNNFENINIATLGLLYIKKGETETGERLYRQSIDNFKLFKKNYLARSAFLNLFNEKINFTTDILELEKLIVELEDNIPSDSQNDLLYRKEKSIVSFNKKLSELKK